MISLENENFIRLILLLIKGGTEVLRDIFTRCLGEKTVSLADFLQSNQKKIRNSKQFTSLQIDILYPPPPQFSDISKWDISLLSRITLLFMGDVLTGPEKLAVDKVRDMRNNLHAHSVSAKIQPRQFNEKWTELSLVITTFSHRMSVGDREKLNNLISSLSSNQLDIYAAMEELKLLVRNDEYFEYIQTSLESLQTSLESLKQSNNQVAETVAIYHQDVLALTNRLCDRVMDMENRGENTRIVNAMFGKVRVSAAENWIVDRAESVLLSSSDESINKSVPSETSRIVAEKVDRLVEDFEKRDVNVDSVKKGCIVFTFTCSSMAALLDLIDYFQSIQIQERLDDIAKALELVLGHKVQLMAYLLQEPLLDIIKKLENTDIEQMPKAIQTTKDQSDVNFTEGEEMDADTVRAENVELLIDIAHLCNGKDREGVENIFLLGKSGAGKSALVNTVIKVIAGKYIPKAKAGAGITQSKTLTLQRFESCGVKREDITHGTQRDVLQRILPRLPTILDAAGKGDINTEALREILELVIEGYIPPGTSIEALEDLQKQYHVGALKDIIYKESRPEWKVTKVVFVQSCRDTVPENLVECLHTVVKTTDPKTAQPLYTGDVYVVITKYDLVMDQTRYDCLSEDQTVTMEEFEKVENSLAKVFNIQGALKDNRIRWVSYTDKNSTDNPYIDNIALKFVKRMVMPGSPKVETVKPMITPAVKMKLEASKWWRSQNFTVMNVFLILVSILVAVLLYKLFTAPL